MPVARRLAPRVPVVVVLLGALTLAGPAGAKTDTIATVAGTGVSGFAGDGGPALAAQLSLPVEVERTADGGYLVVVQGSSRVRRVAPDGTITTIAGNGVASFAGDGGPATAASLNTPNGVAVRPDGGVLIADSGNHRVRLVAPDGTISTVAGTGVPGFSGDAGPATSAQLSFPSGVAVTTDGGFLVVDNDNNRVRRVGPEGTISTVAGNGVAGSAGDGGVATGASLNDPAAVDVLADGSYLVTELAGRRVRLVGAGGLIGTVAGTGVLGAGGDGGPAVAAQLNAPIGVAALPGGAFLIADSGNHRVRLVGADGLITTVAGTGTAGAGGEGGPAGAASLSGPLGVAVAPDGDYLVADTGTHRVRRVDAGDPVVTPPPTVPVRNTTAPSIGAITVNRKPTYVCDPGTWEGLPTPPTFEYEWWRGNPFVALSLGRAKPPTRLATGEFYALPARLAGELVFCLARTRDAAGTVYDATGEPAVLSGSLAVPPVLGERYGNVRIRGIDVFQLVQPLSGAQTYGWPDAPFPNLCGGGTPNDLPLGCAPGVAATPQAARYAGVNLDARKPTTAVVYVDMEDVATEHRLQPLVLTLRGLLGGKPVGSITKTVSNPPVSTTDWVTLAERGDTRFGVNVTVPRDWLDTVADRSSRFDLEATIALPLGAGGGRLEQCALVVAGAACLDDDTFALRGIPVHDAFPDLIVRSVALLTEGQGLSGAGAFARPATVLRDALELWPGGQQVLVEPYSAIIDISTAAAVTMADDACKPFTGDSQPLRACRASLVGMQLESWIAGDAANSSAYDLVLGVHRYGGEPGWNRRVLTLPGTKKRRVPFLSINDGSFGRPRTAAAHEFGHALGLPHAGLTCGNDGNGQVGENWDPADDGRLQGVAFQRTAAGPAERLQRVVDGPTVLHDLMSYCGVESLSWVSPRNWNRTMTTLLVYEAQLKARRLAEHRSAAAGDAYVSGLVTTVGGLIDGVVPADPANRPPEADPASPVTVRALAADGTTLADLGAPLDPLGEAASDVSTFTVGLPAGTAAVELRRGDAVLDRLDRSRPPTVRVLAPAGTVRVRATGALTVRWAAADPDRDALRATVEYSANGRTGWRTVFAGPSTGRASIAGAGLSPASKARVRVTIGDGFSEATAVSAPFAAAGANPAPEILAPAAGQPQSTGARTVLTGRALDGAGVRLRGRALTWFAGTRRLGTGERLAVRLPAGRTTLRLQARDRAVRETVVSRTVQVDAPVLQLTVLRLPARVAAGARTVTLTVATSRAAFLRLRGRSFPVGPKARRITVSLPATPRIGNLRLPLSVAEAGRRPAISLTMSVLRI